MSKGIIYQVGSDGKLTKMLPGKPSSEAEIQALIAQYTEMVAGTDEPLLLIRREAPIADRLDGQGRWSLDHLFVTRDARPVLVEVKQASNTQLRREVIGQLLDYAANASFYWSRGNVAELFRSRFSSEDEALQALEDFLRSSGEGADPDESADPSGFWERVEANLQAGVLKLVIVADEIPRELARVIEFLNEQMQAEVQAVELSWFTSESGLTNLVPRVVGATARATERKFDTSSREPNPYWVELKERYPNLFTFTPWRDNGQDFFVLRTGQPRIVVGARFVNKDLRLFIYFDSERAKEAYRVAKENADELRSRYGSELQWDDMEGYKAARIVDVLPNADRNDRSNWPRQHKWLAEHAQKFRTAMEPILPTIEQALNGARAAS